MNYRLGDVLAEERTLKTREIVDAFNHIDRKDFIPENLKDNAYVDFPLSIGFGQTNSQPTTVGFMLELLAPERSNKVLDVGSGSGWTTALLADIVGPEGFVIGVELIPELVKFGRENIDKYPELPAEIRPAGKVLGLPEDAPFDRILVTAAAEKREQELIDQLKNGGNLVMPIGGSIYLFKKNSEGEVEEEEFPGFAFVPLIYPEKNI